MAQLQQQFQAAVEHERRVQEEVAAAAEQRLDLELRQQQLKYEGQIQVLYCSSDNAMHSQPQKGGECVRAPVSCLQHKQLQLITAVLHI